MMRYGQNNFVPTALPAAPARMNQPHSKTRMRWRERPFALPRRRRLQPPDRNCYGVLFLLAWSAFAFAWSVGAVVAGEFRWGRNPSTLIRPDTHAFLFWGVVGFWFALGVLVAGVSVVGLRTYWRDARISRHSTPHGINEPPAINSPAARRRLSKLSLFLAIATIAFATADLLLPLRSTHRLQSNLTATLPHAQPATTELEAPEGDLGKTFIGLRQVLDYYETKGFIILGSFEHSQWPAKVIQEKEGTNEIRFELKTGPPHVYPGHSGYRLRVVSLEDSAGRETVVVLRSKNKPASRL
jgi:hypothetical protein